MGVKVIAESHVDGLVHFRPEWRRDLWNVVRPDASLRYSVNAEFEPVPRMNVESTPRT
jgi:hypothetical protein